MIPFFFLLVLPFLTDVATGDSNWDGIKSIADLTHDERLVVDWIKAFTVPNTRDSNGGVWTVDSVAKAIRQPRDRLDKSIKPSAWAAAVVTAWALSEGIFTQGYFYANRRYPENQRCSEFAMPKQLPPKTANGFPIEVFSESLCKGYAIDIDTAKNAETTRTKSCLGGVGELIGPNQKCQESNPEQGQWQNGIFGAEQGYIDTKSMAIASSAQAIFQALNPRRSPPYTYLEVLQGTLKVAGFPPKTDVYETVMSCFPDGPIGGKGSVPAKKLSQACRDLVSIWLARNHLLSLTLVIWDNTSENNGRWSSIKVLAKHFNN